MEFIYFSAHTLNYHIFIYKHHTSRKMSRYERGPNNKVHENVNDLVGADPCT